MPSLWVTGVALALALSLPAAGEVDRAVLMADVAALADDAMEGRGTGTPGAARARGLIAGRLSALGLEVEQADFAYVHRGGERTGTNVWARIEGSAAPDHWIVVTAHYDHVGVVGGEIHNGADDNASGVAALLALAAELRRVPPRHSVLLVALDAEEPGLFGASAFVAAPPVPRERILLNVNLDMVSRGDGGELWLVGTGRHPALAPVLEPLVPRALVPLRLGHDHDGAADDGDDWTGVSDHAAFDAAGIPFVYFGVEDHADYHRPTDDADRIDPDFFAGAVGTIVAAARMLDAAPEPLAEARRAAGGEAVAGATKLKRITRKRLLALTAALEGSGAGAARRAASRRR